MQWLIERHCIVTASGHEWFELAYCVIRVHYRPNRLKAKSSINADDPRLVYWIEYRYICIYTGTNTHSCAFKCKIKYVRHNQFVFYVDSFVYLMIFVCAFLVTGGFMLLICLKGGGCFNLSWNHKNSCIGGNLPFLEECDLSFFSLDFHICCSWLCLWSQYV